MFKKIRNLFLSIIVTLITFPVLVILMPVCIIEGQWQKYRANKIHIKYKQGYSGTICEFFETKDKGKNVK